MSAPLIGMSFASFVVLLIISGIAGAIVHWVSVIACFRGSMGAWPSGWLRGWARGSGQQCWAIGLTSRWWPISTSFQRCLERLLEHSVGPLTPRCWQGWPRKGECCPFR